MQFLKVIMVTGMVLGLSGCTLLDSIKDVFNNEETQTATAPADKATQGKATAGKTTTTTKKTTKRRHTRKTTTKTTKSSEVNATETEEILGDSILNSDKVTPSTTPNTPTDVSGCQYSASTINNELASMARLALRSFQPSQPNKTLIRPVSVTGNACGSNPTQAVYNGFSSTGKFSVVSSSQAQRIENQLHNASNGYMIRVAKSQNINYVVSGNVNTNKGIATLKIVDVSTGSVLWQHTGDLTELGKKSPTSKVVR